MVKRPTFSVVIFPTAAADKELRIAKLAEELGYDGVWVGDSHIIWREMYTLMGAIAAQTSRVFLGSGVTHPRVRHLSVTASAMATLAELAPDRIRLGIGIGASGPRNVGLKPSPLHELEQAIAALRGLLRGEEVRLGDRDMRLMFVRGLQIPIYLAASSGRAHELAGRIAEGVITGDPKHDAEGVRNSVHRGALAAGRDPASVEVVCWTPCCIAEDGREAREAVRPMVARAGMVTFGRKLRLGEPMEEEDKRAAEELEREYDYSHHMTPAYSHLAPERWIDMWAAAGTVGQVRERIDEILRGEVHEIAVVPWGKDREGVIRRFAKEVMEEVRKAGGSS